MKSGGGQAVAVVIVMMVVTRYHHCCHCHHSVLSLWFSSISFGFTALFKNFLTDSSVNLQISISLSKLPMIRFCQSTLEMSLKTILYEFSFRSTFLWTGSSKWRTRASLTLPSVTIITISPCIFRPILLEIKGTFPNCPYSE